MLYLKANSGLKIIVLESANLGELIKGHPAVTADKSVMIAWTPDPVWLADKIMDSKGDGKLIGQLIDEAAKRPEKESPRPHHKMRADQNSLAALKEICEYVHNRLPARSWGSEEKVDEWIEFHQLAAEQNQVKDEGELIASETDGHGGLHTVHVGEVEESVLDPRD